MQPIYRRVLLKISGEALASATETYDPAKLDFIAREVADLQSLGVQVGLVVGAGNIWRGRHGGAEMSRTTADAMGMLATAINALALSEAIRAVGGKTTVQSAVPMGGFIDLFSAEKAIAALESGLVVVFAAGIGNPFFSTDTAAVMRALEIKADATLLAKNVAGVFTADPRTDPDAMMYRCVSQVDCVRLDLKAADLTAMTMSMEYDLTIEVFELTAGNIRRAACGESPGTTVTRTAPEGGLFT